MVFTGKRGRKLGCKDNKQNKHVLIDDEDEAAAGIEGNRALGDDRPPMFRLLRFYGVASAAAFVVISVVLVVADRLHEFDKLIDAVERQNVGVAHSFANVVWPKFSGYATSIGNFKGDALRARRETSELHDAVLQLTGGLPVLRIKVYDRSGMTIYSSEKEQIGMLDTGHFSYVADAADGVTRSEYFHSQNFSSLVGHLRHRDIVESYLPIWTNDGKVEGVVEIYTDITQDLLMLDNRTVETAVFAATIFTTLYAILFLIVARANAIVKRQYVYLLQSRKDLDQQNAALIDEIARRETLTRNLKISELRHRSVSDRLIAVQEEERRRVARELHDGIGQGLADISGRVQRALGFLVARRPGEVRKCLETAANAVKSNMEEVRRISMGLRPSILDDLGIVSTLSWACRTFHESHPEIEISQKIDVAEQELSESVKTVIYRCLQEGLNNIARHSSARRVRVSLDKHGDRVRFTISDNGRGIPPFRADPSHEVRPMLGTCSLRERALHSGGTFQLKSIVGRGTTIRLSWPRQRLRTGPTDPAVLG